MIFLLRHFGKQKRLFSPKLFFNPFKFLHYREDSDSVICHTCAVTNQQKLLHLETKKRKKLLQLILLTGRKLRKISNPFD